MKFKHLKNVHIQHPVAIMFSGCEAVPINLKATQIKVFVASGLQKITELGITIDEKQSEPNEKLQVSHERRSLLQPDIAFDSKSRIHHVGNYRIGGKTLAVICTNQGVFVEFDGTLHALLTQLHENTFDPHVLYGPTALFQDRILCVGSSTGSVLFYRAQQHQPLQQQKPQFAGVPTGQMAAVSIITRQVPTDALNFDYCGSVKLLGSSINAMAADSRSLAVADRTGKILVLNGTRGGADATPGHLQPLQFYFSGSSTNSGATEGAAPPCTEITCMRFSQLPNDYLIAGTMSGKVHYFERSTGQLRYAIDAHAKAVSDISVRNNTLLTTSQDGFVRVWILDDSVDRLIHTQSIKIDDAYPTGVTFLNDRMFCAVSYDDPIVQFFESCVG